MKILRGAAAAAALALAACGGAERKPEEGVTGEREGGENAGEGEGGED